MGNEGILVQKQRVDNTVSSETKLKVTIPGVILSAKVKKACGLGQARGQELGNPVHRLV